MRLKRSAHRARRGAAAVELAVLLPVVCSIAVGSVIFARWFADSMAVAEGARLGALKGAMTSASKPLDAAAIQTAVLSRAARLETPPEVNVSTGTDAAGKPYVEVEVRATLHPAFPYPGVPDSISVVRKVRMRRSS